MINEHLFLFRVVTALLYIFACMIVSDKAKESNKKNCSGTYAFWISFFFTPIFGILVLIASVNQKEE